MLQTLCTWAALVMQVRAVGLEEGEERSLRSELRRMESRRQAVEGCGLVRAALAGGGGGDGGGGVEDGILAVERALKGVLLQEEAATASGMRLSCTQLFSIRIHVHFFTGPVH